MADRSPVDPLTGGCLCGAVRFTVRPPLRQVRICHCGQCQKWSGHIVAATTALSENLDVAGVANLRWYPSSAEAERGFCTTCGSSLFWRRDADKVSILAGCLDQPTGLDVEMHIHVADAPDYAATADGAPRHRHGAPSQWEPPTGQ